MRGIQLFFLSVLCAVNIGWMWKDNPKVREDMDKGYQAWQAGNRTEAMKYYEDALSLKPDAIDALNSLGVIYEELGVPAKAEEKYLAAIKVNYKFLPAYSNLAVLYWNQGNTDKAIYYFQKRVELGNPQDPWTVKAKKALANIQNNQVAAKQADVNQTIDQIAAQPERQEMMNQQAALENEAEAMRAAKIKEDQESLEKSVAASAKAEEKPAVPEATAKTSELPTLKEWLCSGSNKKGSAAQPCKVDTEEMNRQKAINQTMNDLYGEKTDEPAPAAFSAPSASAPVMDQPVSTTSQMKSSKTQYDQPNYSSDDTTVFGTIGRGFHWLWENI